MAEIVAPAPTSTRRPVPAVLAWFALVTGGAIAALWVLLLVSGQVPEVTAGRLDIWFHLVAEWGAAGLLMTAGVLGIRGRPKGRLWLSAAFGALAYTAVNSAGYYAEAGEWGPVMLFAVLVLATAASLGWLIGADREPPIGVAS